MNNPFSINTRAVKRIAYVMVAALLVVAGLPFLQPNKVSADQFANRSIQMSDSAPSGTSITAGVGSGNAVTYRVTFDAVHAASSLVIDFCSGSDTPILDDACTAPTGMGAAAAVTGVTGKVGTGTWAITATAGQVKLANSASGDDIVASSTEVFDITGITNPSTTGTFYARMYTFTSTTWGSYVSATAVNLGANSDYGGIALTTARAITITARVQESLTFCVSSEDPVNWTDGGAGPNANSCAAAEVGANLPAITLGHTVGGTTLVLDAGTIDTQDIFSQLSTNATHGAVINLRSNPGGGGTNATCGGLSADAGTTCAIPPIGATAAAITAGTAVFGLFVKDGYVNAATPASTGTMPASATYNDGVNTNTAAPTTLHFGMDNSTAQAATGGAYRTYSGNVSSTFGSTLAKSSGPTYRLQNQYVFGATAALTTPAGIYTANMSMTATGTF